MTPKPINSITDLNMRQLVAVLKYLKNGSIGFDPFRDPRTATKTALLGYIVDNFTNDAIIDAVKRYAALADEVQILQVLQVQQAAQQVVPQPAMPVVPDRHPVYANQPASKDAVPVLPTDKAQQIAQILGITGGLSQDAVLSLIDARLADINAQIAAAVEKAKVTPKVIELREAGKAPVLIKERCNPAFQEILQVAREYPNVMLVGPAGTGKTYLCHQIARALGRTHASVSCTAGTPEYEFTGRLLPTGDAGKFELHSTPFLDQYTSDLGSFNIDEVDNLDANTFGILNQATANGGFEIAARKAAGSDTYVPRGKSILFACANTFGTGADATYVGRNQLDGASLDRWYMIPIDYDKELEQELLSGELLSWVWHLRDKVAENRLRRVVSTRMIQKIAAAKRAGIKDNVIKDRMVGGWTRDERSKCGV